jgi:hypothetical protein
MLTIFGPGGGRKVRLPKTAAVSRLPLAPRHHEVYGIVEQMTHTTISIRKRDGEMQQLDVSGAVRTLHFAIPTIGHALLARGTYDTYGILHADTVLHAKDRSALWPTDR